MKQLPLVLFLVLTSVAQINGSGSPVSAAEPVAVPCSDASQRAVAIAKGALVAAGIDPSSLDSHFVLTVTDMKGNARSVDIRQLNKDIRIAAGSGAVVSNAHAASVQNGTTKRRLPIWIAESTKPEHFPATYAASALSDSSCKVQYIGEENLSSGSAQHVRIWTEPNDGTDPRISKLLTEADFWFDSASQQIVKARTYIFSPEIINNRSAVDIYYSDFRKLGSRQVAFKMSRFTEGTKTQDIVVNSADFGVGNKESDFAAADGDAQ